MTIAPIKPIRTDADHEAALKEFEGYFDNEPAPGSPEADRFELLGLVINHYEDARYPMPHVAPIEALTFSMAHSGHTQADLARLLGSRSRASEILSGKRGLTLDQIRILARAWRIPAAALVGEMQDA